MKSGNDAKEGKKQVFLSKFTMDAEMEIDNYIDHSNNESKLFYLARLKGC